MRSRRPIQLQLSLFRQLSSEPGSSLQVIRDFTELFEGGFEVFDDFLGENVGVGEIVRVFEAFVSEPEDVGAGFVAADEFFTGI